MGGGLLLVVFVASSAQPLPGDAQPLPGRDGGAVTHAVDASQDVREGRDVRTSVPVTRDDEDDEESEEGDGTDARDAAVEDVPRECREPLVAIDREGHCCLPGQSWRDARCDGTALSCPPGQTRLPSRSECAARERAAGDASVRSAYVGAGVTAQVPPEMALIAGGAFRVNTTLVSLGPYAIDRHEVTAADYARCVAAGRCVAAPDPFGQTTDRATAPVVNVSWEMARRYCAWAGKRLPTEAEWEFAARGIDGRRYPWGERVPQCSLARFAGCGDARLRVGALPAGRSAFGLWDMAGDVAEWVADRMGSRGITGDRTVYDPTGPSSGSQRVVRGGSFVSNPGELENAARRGYDPREGRFDVGFRCARGL